MTRSFSSFRRCSISLFTHNFPRTFFVVCSNACVMFLRQTDWVVSAVLLLSKHCYHLPSVAAHSIDDDDDGDVSALAAQPKPNAWYIAITSHSATCDIVSPSPYILFQFHPVHALCFPHLKCSPFKRPPLFALHSLFVSLQFQMNITFASSLSYFRFCCCASFEACAHTMRDAMPWDGTISFRVEKCFCFVPFCEHSTRW